MLQAKTITIEKKRDATENKKYLFNSFERIEIVKKALFTDLRLNKNKIKVISFSSLTTDLCKKYKSNIILRGLRAVSDFEYEFQLAGMNRKLNNNIETLFLMSDVENQIISSKFVKEIVKLKGNITWQNKISIANKEIEILKIIQKGPKTIPGSVQGEPAEDAQQQSGGASQVDTGVGATSPDAQASSQEAEGSPFVMPNDKFDWGTQEKVGSPVLIIVRTLSALSPLTKGAKSTVARRAALDKVVECVRDGKTSG